ncbi:MAG TPA: carboxypeptidase-like regulatory domain-containing protein [Pseudomonadota bacterium]|nr:carboxypeptidase-like regulatory domain-containing protein [Pseudomonadota bacterium]
MRWRLQDGALQLELYAPMRFSGLNEAEVFLRRFARDAGAMQTLRHALQALDMPTQLHHLREEEVLQRVAGLLYTGRLQLASAQAAPRYPVVWFKGAAKNDASEPEKAKESDESQKNDSAKVPMEWKLEFSDGKAVAGFVSLWEPPNRAEQKLEPDGTGGFKKDDFWRHDAYAVTMRGTVEVTGKVEDSDGKGVDGVEILIEPVYGSPISVKTSGGGTWKAPGLVKEEEFDLTLRAAGAKIEGKLVDSDDKPIAGADLRLQLSGGQSVSVQSGSDGTFKVEDRLPSEGFSIELTQLNPGFFAEGCFEDEKGKPVEGVSARLLLDGGGTITVSSGKDGKFKAAGVMPGEGYSLEILSRP